MSTARIYAISEGEVRVSPDVQHGRLMIRVGEGSIFLDVQDAKDLMAELQRVMGDG